MSEPQVPLPTSRLRRLLRRLGLGLGGALVALALAVIALTETASGRALLLAEILGRVNPLLPGRISIERIAALGPGGIELVGVRVADPRHTPVLAIARVRVAFRLWPLVHGSIEVPSVSLSGITADLSELGEARRGLIAAFVDPDAPKKPPSKQPPPEVRVRQIRIDHASLELPPLAGGKLGVRELALLASFELVHGKPVAELEQLRLAVERAGTRIASITELRARLPLAPRPVSASLQATLLDGQLSFSAEAPLPGSVHWKEQALSGRLTLAGLEPAQLARALGLGGALDAVHAPLSATLQVEGSARAATAHLNLDTPGGPLELEARLRDFQHLIWQLATERWQPARVVEGLGLPEPFVLGAHWQGSVELPSAARSALSVALDARTSLNQRELPLITAQSEIDGSALRELHAELADAHSRIAVAGEVDAKRAGHANVEVRLDARTARQLLLALGQRAPDAQGAITGQLAIAYGPVLSAQGALGSGHFASGPLSVDGLEARIDLQGKPPLLSGVAEFDLKSLRAGELSVEPARVVIRGGPSRYAVRASVHVPERAALDLELDVADASEHGARLSGEGRGSLWDQPWRFSIAPTRFDAPDRIQTQGLVVNVAGQQLELRGRLAGEQAELTLQAHAVKLAELNALFGALAEPGATPPHVHGLLNLDAAFSGAFSRPRASVRLEAREAGVDGYPSLNLGASARLDAALGRAQLDLDAHSAAHSPELQTRLSVESSFARYGNWVNALIDGQHRVQLGLSHLDLEFVAAALGRSLPVTGQVEAQLAAELGRELTLNWQAQARLRSLEQDRVLVIHHSLGYAAGRATTSLTAEDATGPVFQGQATIELPLPRARLEQWAALLQSSPGAQAWSASLDVPSRALAELPLLDLVGAAPLPPIVIAAHAALHHRPSAEPSVELKLSAEQTESAAQPDLHAASPCNAPPLALRLGAEAEAGQFKAQLSGVHAGKSFLDADLEGSLALMKLLAGERVRPEGLRLRARADDVELSSLPFLCERAHGKVGLQLAVNDPLGQAPEATGRLRVDGLSLGSDRVNVRAELSADASSARLSAELEHAKNLSTLKLAAPVHWSGGRLSVDNVRPLSARLDLSALPIAPFVPADSGISYASGNLGGYVAVRGSVADPHLQGRIDLHDVAFTATDLAQPVDHVSGRIRFDDRAIAVEDLVARDQGGQLRLSADAQLQSLQQGSGNLHLVLDKFPVRQNGQVAATVDGDVKLALQIDPKQTHVRLSVDRLDTYLESIDSAAGVDLEPHPELVVDGVPNPDPARRQERALENSERAATLAGARLTRIEIRTKDRFWIKRDDFAMRLNASLDVQIQGEAVRVTGDVQVERGYIDLLGQVFEVDPNEGKLQFAGGGVPDPMVSIKAHHDNRKTGDVIAVLIQGRSSAPKLTFLVNEKEVDAGAAVAAIYGAQQGSGSGQEATVQASSVLRGMTAGLLATAARRQLGALAPILMIEPGDQQAGARVRAGFEFDSLVPDALKSIITGVYFEGILATPGKQNAESDNQQSGSVKTGALLELYFPHNLFSAGQYGPGTTWSLDFGWQL